MAEITAQDCTVLGAFPNAPENSWRDLLTHEDREVFRRVNRELEALGEAAVAQLGGGFTVETTSGFHERSGVRNTRPKDVWVAVVNANSDAFVGMPQVFMIASGRGIEYGFAAAIHRADFSNQVIKRRLALVVPGLFDLLPSPTSTTVQQLQQRLDRWRPRWHYRDRLRKEPGDEFADLSALMTDLQTPAAKKRGAGAVTQYYEPNELTSAVSLASDFARATELFAPLMRYVADRYRFGEDTNTINDMLVEVGVNEPVDLLSDFDPNSLQDARARALRLIVQRQGQAAFRRKMLQAYGGKCAVTRSTAIQTLEAAHIRPYTGQNANVVPNGLLLRADIHTLFDLGLVKVDADRRVWVSPVVDDRQYRALHGLPIHLPETAEDRPSLQALAWHWENVAWGVEE